MTTKVEFYMSYRLASHGGSPNTMTNNTDADIYHIYGKNTFLSTVNISLFRMQFVFIKKNRLICFAFEFLF